jgi:c-di-AMP phosphodiesterase-like protein
MVEIEYTFGKRELLFMEDFYKRFLFKKVKRKILDKLLYLILVSIVIFGIVSSGNIILFKRNLSFLTALIFVFAIIFLFVIIKALYFETLEYIKLKKYIKESLSYLSSVNVFKTLISEETFLINIDGKQEDLYWDNYDSYIANDDIIYLNSKNDSTFFLLKSAISVEDFEKAKQIIMAKLPNG